MAWLRYRYIQLTFGQDKACHHPERTYRRLKRSGYCKIEIASMPDSDTAAKNGIGWLKCCESVVEYRVSDVFPTASRSSRTGGACAPWPAKRRM